LWWIIVVSIIGGLIVLGILLLSIPIDLAFQFEFYGQAKFNLRWSWLFGLLSRDVKPGKPKLKPKPRRKFSIWRTLRSIRSASENLWTKGLMTQFFRLIKGVFRQFKIRNLDINFHVGLDDPSETAYLFALTEPLNRLLAHVQPYSVSIQPSFVEPVFEGYAHGSVRVYAFYTVHILSPRFQVDEKNGSEKMEKKQVAIENPVNVDGLSIIPITETVIYGWQYKGNFSFFGHKRPIYVLISKPESRLEAFTISGEPISTDKIALSFPELRVTLRKLRK
jgi:hypothetical protein